MSSAARLEVGADVLANAAFLRRAPVPSQNVTITVCLVIHITNTYDTFHPEGAANAHRLPDGV